MLCDLMHAHRVKCPPTLMPVERIFCTQTTFGMISNKFTITSALLEASKKVYPCMHTQNVYNEVLDLV